jgi:uncharacterized protein YcbX
MRVSALYVYPVKACRAVALEEAMLGPLGLEHDRHYAFVQADGRALTQRDQPLLATVRPQIDAGVLQLDFGGLFSLRFAKAEFAEPVGVDVWSKRVAARAVAAAALAKAIDYLGAPVRLAMLDKDAQRAFVDSQPVLATTTGMLARLNAELGSGVGMKRFRPNIVLEGDGEWRELRGRDAALEYAKPCGRCEVTTIDQASGARRGPEPLRTLSERFGGDFGLYYRVTRAGRVQRGEALQGA